MTPRSALARLEGVHRAAAGPAAVRHRHRRADLQLFLLGYAATTDVRNVPDRRRRRRPVGGEPRADRALRRVADFTRRRHRRPRRRDRRRTSSDGTRLAGAGDSRRLRRRQLAAGGRQTVQIIADGSDANSAGVALGYADEPDRRVRRRSSRARPTRTRRAAAGRLHRAPACASGSTRDSRAATS